MIPKKIHYCWFGNAEKPDSVLKCIKSWKKFCPDYEIIEWNENNYNIRKNKFISQAYDKKQWAFVTDYARLDVVYNNGGIYFDTDVEVIKNFDTLLENHAFMGFENGRFINTGLGFGAEKKHSAIKGMMDFYDKTSFLDEYGIKKKNINSPYINSGYLTENGTVLDDSMQNINGITIYPTEYFSPLNYSTGELNITENTYSIHWYSMSWFDPFAKFYKRIERKLSKVVGITAAVKIVNIINIPYRACNKIKKILTVKIKELLCHLR